MQQDQFASQKQPSDFRGVNHLHRTVRVDVSAEHRSKPVDEIIRSDRIHEREMEEPERWDGMS